LDITNYVLSCVDDFKAFVGIDSFPDFKIIPKEITLEKADKHGYDAPASAIYDSSTGLHSLEIWSKLCLPQMNAKYFVFHELTHILDAQILDAQVHSQNNNIKHVLNKGYTEFHASQIDFMQIVGAENIFTPFSFDMNQMVKTISGEKTANEYLDESRILATDLIERTDFPANIYTLLDTLGIIFNYYGKRSICKMHAKNYKDQSDLGVITGLIGEDNVKILNSLMLGWLEPSKVVLVDTLFKIMVMSLAQKYHLL